MVGAIIEIVSLALQLWVSKDKRKYVDALTKIEDKYREEESKPYMERDHAVLDNLEFELRQLIRNISADARKENPLVPS